MGLKENLSRLSPNEFLEKMQDMFQMYQESQEDYYEEGLNQDRKAFRNSDSQYNNKGQYLSLSKIKENTSVITRFIERLYAALKNKKVDEDQAENHMKQLLESISLKETYEPNNLKEFLVLMDRITNQLGRINADPLISKHWKLQDKLRQK